MPLPQASSSGSSSSGARSTVTPLPQETESSSTGEAGAETVTKEAPTEVQASGCGGMLLDELTLTQLVEEGIEEAAKDDDLL